MGLFGKLKDAVGIGSLKADIILTAPGYYAGDTLAGNVVLSEAATDTKVTSVLLQLVRLGTDVEITDVVTDDYWHGPQLETYEQEFKINQVEFEQFVGQDFVVTKGQRLELPFEVNTPPDMEPTDQYNKWILKIHVDLPGKVDCRVAKPLKIMMGGGGPVDYAPEPVDSGGDLPAPGERILAFYEDAHYECTVASVEQAGINVSWDDGTTSII